MTRLFDDECVRDGAAAANRPWFARWFLPFAALTLLVGVAGCAKKDVEIKDAEIPGVEVPHVVGLTVDEAREKLVGAGFEARLGDPELTNDKPAGLVAAQEPGEGAKAAKGSAVVLRVAAKDSVTVPTVTGLPLEEAKAKLSTAGLEAEQGDAERTNRHPPGTVLRQEPAADAKVDRGSAVTLTMAAQDSVRVPAVTGSLIAAAEAELKAAGLVPLRAAPVLRTDVPKGIVVQQYPAANAEVPRGKLVALTWSADGVKVPKIIGKRMWTNNKTAEEEFVRLLVLLKDQGFFAKFTAKSDASKPPFTIVGTDPKEGALVARGSTLNLTYSSSWTGEWKLIEDFQKRHGLAPPPVLKLAANRH
jgi:beta-lactam-binding protein with PASTA domain